MVGVEEGMEIGISGWDIRCVIWAAAAAVGFEEVEGLGRSFLVGRCEEREVEVGIDSGIGSDIVGFVFLVALRREPVGRVKSFGERSLQMAVFDLY